MLFSSLIQNEREACFWKKNESFGVSTPCCTFVPSQAEWFRCRHRRSDRRESGSGSKPEPAHVKPGQCLWAAARHLKLLTNSWLTWGYGWCVVPKGACHYSSLVLGVCSVHCRNQILLRRPDALDRHSWFSCFTGDVAVQRGSLANGVPNQQILIQPLTGLHRAAQLPSVFSFPATCLKYRCVF